MEQIQADALRAAYPTLAVSIHSLGSLAGLHADVVDPTGCVLPSISPVGHQSCPPSRNPHASHQPPSLHGLLLCAKVVVERHDGLEN